MNLELSPKIELVLRSAKIFGRCYWWLRNHKSHKVFEISNINSNHCILCYWLSVFYCKWMTWKLEWMDWIGMNWNEWLHTSLQDIIKVVNNIKSIFLHEKVFHQFCSENNEDYNHLLLCLQKFIAYNKYFFSISSGCLLDFVRNISKKT